MRPSRWLLPDVPDVLALLTAQMTPTLTATEAFAAWTAGDPAAAATVRRCEHEADKAKRALQRALRSALITPLEPEDLFSLSQTIDWIVNEAKDAIGESEAMNVEPDAALAAMSRHLAAAIGHLSTAVGSLGTKTDAATVAAEAAIKEERRLERAYRAAMGDLMASNDAMAAMARRELYRRCSRMGTTVVDVAERIIYATYKVS
jgi:uncharacterized protein Yka (UPF0111/DUF47 family)